MKKQTVWEHQPIFTSEKYPILSILFVGESPLWSWDNHCCWYIIIPHFCWLNPSKSSFGNSIPYQMRAAEPEIVASRNCSVGVHVYIYTSPLHKYVEALWFILFYDEHDKTDPSSHTLTTRKTWKNFWRWWFTTLSHPQMPMKSSRSLFVG